MAKNEINKPSNMLKLVVSTYVQEELPVRRTQTHRSTCSLCSGGRVTRKDVKSMECWSWQWQSYRCSRPRFLVLVTKCPSLLCSQSYYVSNQLFFPKLFPTNPTLALRFLSSQTNLFHPYQFTIYLVNKLLLLLYAPIS